MHNLWLMRFVHGLAALAALSFTVACGGTGDPAEPTGSELAAPTAPSSASGSTTAAPKPAEGGPRTPTTFAGQVALGETLFAQRCARCHGERGEGSFAPRLIGRDQGALRSFATADELADYIIRFMPPGGGGSLTREEYFSVVAFGLKANGIPVKDAILDDKAASEIALH